MRSKRFHLHKRAMLASGVVLTAALTLVGGVSAAGAKTTHALPAAAVGTANFWGAGWASLPTISGNTYLVSASATFVVPTLNCSANTKKLGASFGVEQGALGPFKGYEQSIVTEECNTTTPSYQFVVAVGTTSFTEGGVSPGDTVVASFFQSSTLAQSIVHDLTSGVTWIADGTPFQLGAADIGEFDVIPVSAPLRVAPFGSVTFTKVQVNGDYLGFGNNLTSWFLRLGSSGTNISTGAIKGEDSFKLTFKFS